MWLVEIYATQMPKLQAREALHFATVIALGSGKMKKQDLASVRKGWMREAGLGKARKPQSPEEFKMMMGAMGIGVKHGG